MKVIVAIGLGKTQLSKWQAALRDDVFQFCAGDFLLFRNTYFDPGMIASYLPTHISFPPTIVHTTFASLMFSAGILNRSSDNITKSAYFPALIEPRFCSARSEERRVGKECKSWC